MGSCGSCCSSGSTSSSCRRKCYWSCQCHSSCCSSSCPSCCCCSSSCLELCIFYIDQSSYMITEIETNDIINRRKTLLIDKGQFYMFYVIPLNVINYINL